MFAPSKQTRQRVCQRAFDLTGALFGLVIFSWLLLGLWLLVRSTSRGPAILKQERVGRDGKRFNLYKFRSMLVGAPIIPGEYPGDEWLTAIGRVLRHCKLDELPQLVNVLIGHMSLDGPRPHHLPEHLLFEETIPGYVHRLAYQVGMTSPGKLDGHDDYEAELALDLHYYELGFSLRRSTKLILRTIGQVITCLYANLAALVSRHRQRAKTALTLAEGNSEAPTDVLPLVEPV